MLSLLKSERFQADYKKFAEEIEKIEDLKIKSNLENLLQKLVTQVKSLDKKQNDLIFSKDVKTFDRVNMSSSIMDTRKSLERKIKDYKETLKIK